MAAKIKIKYNETFYGFGDKKVKEKHKHIGKFKGDIVQWTDLVDDYQKFLIEVGYTYLSGFKFSDAINKAKNKYHKKHGFPKTDDDECFV